MSQTQLSQVASLNLFKMERRTQKWKTSSRSNFNGLSVPPLKKQSALSNSRKSLSLVSTKVFQSYLSSLFRALTPSNLPICYETLERKEASLLSLYIVAGVCCLVISFVILTYCCKLSRAVKVSDAVKAERRQGLVPSWGVRVLHFQEEQESQRHELAKTDDSLDLSDRRVNRKRVQFTVPVERQETPTFAPVLES